MGSGYSAEQRKEFEPYHILIDKALTDKEYHQFQNVRNKLCTELTAKKP